MPSPECVQRAPAAPRSRSFSLVAALIAGLLLAGLISTDALADRVAATLDNTDVTLTPTEGGGWTAAVGMTNLTDRNLEITAAADPTVDGCETLTLGENGTLAGTLPAAHHAEITVTAGSRCPSDKAVGLLLKIAAGKPAAGATPAAVAQDPLAVTATPKKTQPVNWKALSAFIWATGAALLLMVVVYGTWALLGADGAAGKSPLQPLTGLTASWSFKDSVASNLTAASGLVAIFLGSSDFLKSALGPKSEAAIAGATIAGAVALALVGAAGVIALTVREPKSKYIAIGGLLLGTTLALGAAGGQVWAITRLLGNVDLGGVGEPTVTGAKWGATVMLIAYGFVSVYGLLQQGTKTPDTDPLAPPAPVEIAAAAIIAASAGAMGKPEEIEKLDYAKVNSMIGKLTKPAKQPATGSPEGLAATAAAGNGQPEIVLVAQPEPGLPLAGRSALP